MASLLPKLNLGRRVAPPRFVLFCFLFPTLVALLTQRLGIGRATLVGFDAASFIFLLSISTLLGHGEAAQIRAQAARNDANRAVLLGVTAAVTLVILVAVAKELQGKNDALAIALCVATLVLAWLFANTVYAVHYAHLYYDEGGEAGEDAGGLKFRDCDDPDYWDFLYFSNTLGMAFATSDTLITSRRIRRIALGQTYAAFIFNLGVIAFAVGALGGA